MLTEKLQNTVSYIKSKYPFKPTVGVILGSGLGTFVKKMKIEHSFPFIDIPNFVPPTVEGHTGNLIFGSVDNIQVIALQGRIHYYEGHGMETIVLPTRVMAMLGINTLLITNSAGGLDPQMNPGDFMILEDHINLMGANPLTGPNVSELGPRFPDMTEAYDKGLRQKLEIAMKKNSVVFHKGVYCAVSGPTYETPAEVRYLRLIGGSAVGMSTVPEVIAANHLGLKVCAVSCITNKAAGISSQKLSHNEVTDTAKKVESQFSGFVVDFITSL
jgi:purine-nucleoside phosphorylase